MKSERWGWKKMTRRVWVISNVGRMIIVFNLCWNLTVTMLILFAKQVKHFSNSREAFYWIICEWYSDCKLCASDKLIWLCNLHFHVFWIRRLQIGIPTLTLSKMLFSPKDTNAFRRQDFVCKVQFVSKYFITDTNY